MAVADVTELLEASREGNAGARERLMAAVYDELRGIAAAYRAQNRLGDTLTATSLVHEAYLKLVDGSRLSFNGRGHFFASASRAMRQVIVDAARAQGRQKRGAGAEVVSLDDTPTLAADGRSDEVLALDRVLRQFEAIDPRAAHVVECRYFAGLTVAETAEALGVSPMTVKRDWTAARAWLHHALTAA